MIISIKLYYSYNINIYIYIFIYLKRIHYIGIYLVVILFYVAHLQCSPSCKATKGFQFISWDNMRNRIGKNGGVL